MRLVRAVGRPFVENAVSPERLPYPRYRERHGGQDRWRLLLALLLALPLGALLAGFAALLSNLPEEATPLGLPPTQVALLAVPGQQWQQNRQVLPGAKPAPGTQAIAVAPEKKPEEKKPEPDRIPGQIVDVAPTPDTSPPADTHRYSEYNTHVAKESQARDKTAFYKNA